MAGIVLKNVTKVYDNEMVAVRDFNLEIADREFVVLVGPSGCGKSTTLRMIAGLEEITEGELYIGGRLVNDVPPKDRDISMVFQNYALYPHMTVYQNMAFALKLRKERRSEIDRKVREAAEILDITRILKKKPRTLSGGQRQRVAIGRSIVRNPQVFLMDEPLSNLDAKLRNQMRAELIKLRQRLNTTFVYVTHDQTEAMTLGDRMVIMNAGVIQQVGSPQEVFDRPANLFVAGFIGTPQMNFFEAELTREENGSYTAAIGGENIILPEETQQGLRDKNVPSGEVTLGVRPEHIVQCAPDEPGCMRAKVELSEIMGSSINLHTNMENGNRVVMVQHTMDLPADLRNGLPYGTEVGFRFEGNTVHVFDKKTQDNVLL